MRIASQHSRLVIIRCLRQTELTIRISLWTLWIILINLVITGDNHSGVAYTLDELKDWGEDFYAGEGQLYDDNSVIVCEQPDGNYYYYYLDDFLALFDRGELRIEFDNNEEYQITQDEYLQQLEDGTLTTSGFYRRAHHRSGGEYPLHGSSCNFGDLSNTSH